jgi:two-component system response regulator RegA
MLALSLLIHLAEAEMSQSQEQTHAPCPRVLIVDDDQDLMEAIAGWLESRCGAHVTSCRSAEEAMVATTPKSFDVFVLDYRLDGADGVTLGAMLREINPEARLILLSGDLSATIETSAFEHGFGRVFAKPVAPEILFDAIAH